MITATTTSMRLFRSAEALRQEAVPKAAAIDKALKDLRLRYKVGRWNKLGRRNRGDLYIAHGQFDFERQRRHDRER